MTHTVFQITVLAKTVMKFSQNQWQIDNYLIELGYPHWVGLSWRRIQHPLIVFFKFQSDFQSSSMKGVKVTGNSLQVHVVHFLLFFHNIVKKLQINIGTIHCNLVHMVTIQASLNCCIKSEWVSCPRKPES